ncbi:ImmA/IrrE family metallo-endopeptidase [Ornithinibacillus sp. JPR2-1]|uniref:ImmA/IrrE family metallo-endopeptidase n=1 Tax=Ornithinibacillus sp. JPR2-1 TaxID=2094019 RepID=UPI0031E2855C
MYSHLEDFIHQLLLSIQVTKPEHLEMHSIARKLGVKITYEENKVFRCENEINLTKSTRTKEWYDFAHELCHYLRHCGNQLVMHPLFRQLQEYQANHFVYHFCVPTFMLEKIPYLTASIISQKFNVEFDFALRRLEMHQNSRRYLG